MKFFYLFAVTLFFFACQVKVNEFPEPKDLIPKETLISILEELMVIEQTIQTNSPQLNQFQKIAQKSGDTILKKHHVSFKRFDEAMTYYGSHQEEMKAIYNEVLERLNTKLNKL